MFKTLALSLLLLLSPPAFAGKLKSHVRALASTHACSDAKCPLNMIHCGEGTHRIDVRQEGSCCPKWKCEKDKPGAAACLHVACTKGQPSCKDGEVLINKAAEGACCPDWECIEDETEEL
jgi:hypothetical protein